MLTFLNLLRASILIVCFSSISVAKLGRTRQNTLSTQENQTENVTVCSVVVSYDLNNVSDSGLTTETTFDWIVINNTAPSSIEKKIGLLGTEGFSRSWQINSSADILPIQNFSLSLDVPALNDTNEDKLITTTESFLVFGFNRTIVFENMFAVREVPVTIPGCTLMKFKLVTHSKNIIVPFTVVVNYSNQTNITATGTWKGDAHTDSLLFNETMSVSKCRDGDDMEERIS